MDEALTIMRGVERSPSVAGLAELAFYFPSAFVQSELEQSGRAQSIQHILFAFVQPLVAALIGAVFFLLALDLFGRLRTALGLTLILAFTTMVWPYAKFGMENHQTLWTLASAWLLARYVRGPTLAGALWFAGAMGMLALTNFSPTSIRA